MPSDLDLPALVRSALTDVARVREIKMFGGVGFMLKGNLLAGASKRGLLMRVGKEQQERALSRAGARPTVMKGRAMQGYVSVDASALNARTVRAWIKLALAFVETLPPKTPGRKPKQKVTKDSKGRVIKPLPKK